MYLSIKIEKPASLTADKLQWRFRRIFFLVRIRTGGRCCAELHPPSACKNCRAVSPANPTQNYSFGSKGCQSNLQVGIEIRFCPGLPTCFSDQARKLAKDIFPSRQLRKVLSPWGYHSLPYPGLRNVIKNEDLVGMAVNKLNRLWQMTFKYQKIVAQTKALQ